MVRRGRTADRFSRWEITGSRCGPYTIRNDSMRGFFTHFLLTLRLNFRSRQALVYGYLVPIFFLIAFGAIFRSGTPPLLRELGQLITISVLGGACFGMPTAMVAERERGVWRRYRLLPARIGTIVISTMLARFVIVLSAAVMQIALAGAIYGMPMPRHPWQMSIAFALVSFAFLGMGLVIAMLADTVPAVQALGQAIFLPMIMIGGVGVPLWTLPVWAQHVAGFLPGKYAVQVLQQCAMGEGLGPVGFDSAALIVIGGAACVAGAKMFRWDAHEQVEPRQRRWVIVALLAWLSVGAIAEWAHRPVGMADEAGSQISLPDRAPYKSITEKQIDGIRYNDLEPDDSLTTPVAANLDGLDPAGKQRISELRRQLDGWPPARDKSAIKSVRNLLSVAAIADLIPDRYEGAIAYVVFEKLKTDVPRDDLKKILTWIVVSPDDKQIIVAVPELGIDGKAAAADVNERVKMYARKLLGRLVGKLPMAE